MTENQLYQKGFNEGYLITQHLPELAQSLSEINSQTPRMEGFKDGRKQYVLDKFQERSLSWSKPKADKNITPESVKDIQPGNTQDKKKGKEPER